MKLISHYFLKVPLEKSEPTSALPLMVLTVLSVAEKPSVAKELAKIISGGENFERRNGKSQYNPIYILRDCPFKGSKCTMKITSVTGHMMEIDFEERYKSWTGCNAIDLFEAPIRKQVKKESENIEKTLRDESNSCNVLLLWLDCDLEGENISFEVIDVCKKANPRLEVYRARFSALIHRDIMRTLNNPDRPNQQQSDAVEARQEIDLRLGAAFTRFQSLRLQNRFPQLQSKVISYGPCQFPTLGFVADRYIKIKEFRPEEFWSISFSFEGVSVDGDRCFCDFAWRRHRVFDRFTCAILYESCFTQNSSSNEMQVVAQIKAVDASPTSRFKPLPLNTIELQKRASRFLSMSSEHTMKIAEELYQRGILSYPRTETDYFKDGIDLKGLLEEHRGHDQWGEYCARLLDGTSTSNHFEWPRKGGHDDQAHPPIHPTKCVNSNELKSNDEKKLYDLVCRHFFACCSMDAKGAKTNVSIQIKNCDECFSTTGLMVLERNWLEIYPFERWNGSKLPKFSVGQEIIPTVFIMKSGRTCPPPLLNESDLIAEMDRCGIGTDATIAEHISKILTRDYATKISTSLPSLPSLEGINEGDRDLDGSDDELVDRRPQPPDNRNQPVSNNRSSHGMYFSPTPLGLALVEGYNSMGYQLTKPFLRASMELDCKRVARGEVSKDVVVRHCMEDMKKCFETVVREATRLDSAMSKYFGYSSNGDSFGNRRNGYNGLPIDQNTYSLSQSRFSKCGTCQQLMDLKVEVQSNAQHHNPNNSLPKKILVCSSCSKTLFLPIRGELKAVNQTCVICNYQVISILNIETQKSHHVCPFCFKNPPPPPVGDSELNEFRCVVVITICHENAIMKCEMLIYILNF